MLHSDQGREFESDLWQSMCHYLAICKTRTNPYRPQSDGQVERFNRTLIQVLKPLVNEHMDDWDEQVDFVVHAYNSTVHASTNCSPNLLVFGEDLIMPADLVFGLVGISPEAPCTVMFVEGLRDQFKFAYDRVRLELEKNANWQKVGYDTGLKSRFFQVGDQVVRLHEPLSNLKLSANWDGPFIISRIVSETTVVIKSSIGRFYKSNVARLRPWRGREMATGKDKVVTVEPLVEAVLKTVGPVVGKKGRGRPRKVLPINPVAKAKGGKVTRVVKGAKKIKVSRIEKNSVRKVNPKAMGALEKAGRVVGSKLDPTVVVRRSPRLLGTAVT